MPNKGVPVAEWLAQAKALFGDDVMAWRFECPICHHVQTPGDFKAIGVDPQASYRECIGRHKSDRASHLGATQPCDYATYGLFRIGNTVITETGEPVTVFPFATGSRLMATGEPPP